MCSLRGFESDTGYARGHSHWVTWTRTGIGIGIQTGIRPGAETETETETRSIELLGLLGLFGLLGRKFPL